MPPSVTGSFALLVFMKHSFIALMLLLDTEMKRFFLYMCILQTYKHIRIQDDLGNKP